MFSHVRIFEQHPSVWLPLQAVLVQTGGGTSFEPWQKPDVAQSVSLLQAFCDHGWPPDFEQVPGVGWH